MSQTLSGLFLVGAVNRPGEEEKDKSGKSPKSPRTNRENPEKNRESPEKEKKGRRRIGQVEDRCEVATPEVILPSESLSEEICPLMRSF